MAQPAGSTVTSGDARITALLDSEGPFFLPLREAFPGATEKAIARAARLDPNAGRDAEGWWLAFRAYVVEVGARLVLVDTGAASDTAARTSRSVFRRSASHRARCALAARSPRPVALDERATGHGPPQRSVDLGRHSRSVTQALSGGRAPFRGRATPPVSCARASPRGVRPAR
jgi:hypothetical protein